MLQCKHIETMSQQAKVDLLNALIVTREGYESGDLEFITHGLCNHAYRANGVNERNYFHITGILVDCFGTNKFPFNEDVNEYATEDKSTNPKRMKFLNDLIATLEASIEQMAWR